MASYEVLALRYGMMMTSRRKCFYQFDHYDEADSEKQMDYFFWVIRGDEETILVDTGYHPDAAARRPGRVCVIPPVEALARIGIAPESVSQLVVTHFHFDHIGNVSSFPNAKVVLQELELEFWTGRHGQRPAVARSTEASEILYLQEACESGHVKPLVGDAEVAPGVKVHLVGGHCPGQQIVTVESDNGDGPIVLASDALHFYEEMDRYMPFDIFTDLPDMYGTYERLRDLREHRGATIVAGHDPIVMEKFPRLGGTHNDLGVRLA